MTFKKSSMIQKYGPATTLYLWLKEHCEGQFSIRKIGEVRTIFPPFYPSCSTVVGHLQVVFELETDLIKYKLTRGEE